MVPITKAVWSPHSCPSYVRDDWSAVFSRIVGVGCGAVREGRLSLTGWVRRGTGTSGDLQLLDARWMDGWALDVSLSVVVVMSMRREGLQRLCIVVACFTSFFLPLRLQGTRFGLTVFTRRGVQGGITSLRSASNSFGCAVVLVLHYPRSQNWLLGRVSVHGSYASSFLWCLPWIVKGCRLR